MNSHFIPTTCVSFLLRRTQHNSCSEKLQEDGYKLPQKEKVVTAGTAGAGTSPSAPRAGRAVSERRGLCAAGPSASLGSRWQLSPDSSPAVVWLQAVSAVRDWDTEAACLHVAGQLLTPGHRAGFPKLLQLPQLCGRVRDTWRSQAAGP